MTGIEKIKIFPAASMRQIADKYLTVYYKRVFMPGGRDKTGARFPKYSKSYAALIVRDFRRTRTDKRGKAGERLKYYKDLPASTIGGKLGTRPLFLTGKTSKNMRRRTCTSEYFEIGWDSENDAAAIMKGNAERGRDAINDIPNKEKDWIIDQMGKIFDDEVAKKVKDRTVINISI
jgi:hypothetical protein